MQIKPAPASCYRKPRIDETDHPEARRRLAILAKVAALRERGVSVELALLAAEVPRSTYYRWRRALRRDGVRGLVPRSRRPRRVRQPRWTREAERRVWALRRRYPFMGKRRLRVLLAREGVRLSESTVGRIVAKGMRRGRIRPCAFCRGRVTVKQRRRFDGHAQRWRYGQRARQPGELVQIDHLSASRESKQLKEFKAVSPVGKQLVARVYSRATARNAKRFPDAVRADLPHDLLSVQVDGGSEFRAAFEQACEELRIPLYVLPPRRPQYNGCVERANDTTRVEFWNLYDGEFTVEAANRALADYQHFHNHVRPHQALDWLTPNEYLISKDCPSQSQMS